MDTVALPEPLVRSNVIQLTLDEAVQEPLQPTENVSLLALPLLSVQVQSSASPSIVRYVAVPPLPDLMPARWNCCAV